MLEIVSAMKKNMGKEYGDLGRGGSEEEGWKSVLEQLSSRLSSDNYAFQKS